MKIEDGMVYKAVRQCCCEFWCSLLVVIIVGVVIILYTQSSLG